ncbi:MAG: family 78 glycoside hydrolase catalytic domain [Fimbriimonadales bacterium]
MLACMMTSTALASQSPKATVTGLRCEYLADPIGIDEPSPRLSWIVEYPGRDWRQSAYQITVASSPSRLNAKADLWDTGKVASSGTIQIPYRGRALASGEECFWRVQVWDQHGVKSAWSRAGRWQMGLLNEEAWHGAAWIGGTAKQSPAPAPLLRGEFEVAGKVRMATLCACGLGYAELHLNGQKLGGASERDPGYTNFDKRVLYVTHDVTSLVKPGVNAVGAILGTGWYDAHDRATWNFDKAPWRGRPRLRLLLTIEYADGHRQTVASGQGWKTADSPILFDGIYTGEVYDARQGKPGWDKAGFDDHGWPEAAMMPAPKGKLVARCCPSVAITQSFAPRAIKEPKPGVYVVDFGQNLSGHVQLKVRAAAGTKITMRYSERVGPDGMIERSQIEQFMAKANPPQPFQSDTYICNGGGLETWEQRFSYSGFRFAEVTGFPGKPTKDNFKARFAHTDFESAGGFECSNDLLNKIQQATRYAYLSNAQSIPTDCPQREKNGWTGDAHLAAEAGLMNFRSESFYKKWLEDFANDQAADGKVSVIVPSGGWGAGAFNPAWDSAYPIIADDLYRYCGDTRVLARHYDPMKRYVDALAAKTKDGVIPFDSLGDWVPWSTQTSSQLTSTAFLFLDARIVARAAGITIPLSQHEQNLWPLPRPAEAEHYSNLAEATRLAFNEHFWDATHKWYGNGSQTAQAISLYFGLVPEDRKNDTFAALVKDAERQGHIDTGILGAKYVLRVLSENGRSDLAYKLVARKEQPGWGWWIEQGATTLWEDWKGESSLNHIMFGDVSNWFVQWIAGIQFAPEGYRRFLIKPHPVGDLTWARAWHDSPHGQIVSEWSRNGSAFRLKVVVPANCVAFITMPGQPEDAAKETRIGSGTYEFTSVVPERGP